MIKNNSSLMLMVLLLLVLHQVSAYKVENGSEVHQYITKQGLDVWRLLPIEIRDHARNPITTNIQDSRILSNSYDIGDDIIDGSGEEDVPPIMSGNHFWQPDNPKNGRYSDGFRIIFDSSYERAKYLFTTKVIPFYLKGDINESYYWLGRVAHLLEDATVPAHMHLDCHIPPVFFGIPCGDADILESYTGNSTVFQSYNGSKYSNLQYNHEDLPNIDGLDWSTVDATSNYKQYIELFRLFWYTAQKTQYYASNDVDGNDTYMRVTGGNPIQFSPSLWQNEVSPANIITQQSQVQANVDKIANASLPHAMKAVAGLYRLFWDYAHTDWPTFHHDNRRTGFTILKGDMPGAANVQRINLVLEGNVNQDAIARASVGDLDNDGDQDIVIAASKLGGGVHDGIIFASEIQRILGVSTRRIVKKWQFDIGYEVEAPPSLGNTDGDKQREIVFGSDDGNITLLNINADGTSASRKWNFTVPKRYSQSAGSSYDGDLAFTAIEDVDLDGKNEILFLEGQAGLPDWPGNIYILEDGGIGNPIREANYTLGNGGGHGAPSIADIDGDNKPEIVAPSYYGVFVFDYDNSALTPKWSNSDGKITGAVVIADVDKDGVYELVYTTHTSFCHASRTCYNRVYIRNALTGANEGGSPIELPATSRVTPAIGDVDNDGDVEIVINLELGTGQIRCYEINGNNCPGNWPYNAPGVTGTDISTDIVDIDGDGKYDILYVKNNANKISLLNGAGTSKFELPVDGQIGSAPAIADVDGDGVAELVVKRVGSPITILTAVSYNNQQPTFNTTMNLTLTGIAGGIVDVNKYGDLHPVDADNDNLNILYSPPFNSSGHWQTTVNDTGDYISFVEVTDGNLSDVKELDVKVFSPNTKFVDTFADGTTQKSLSYTGSESKQVTVRLPKDAKVIFSRLRIEGRAP